MFGRNLSTFVPKKPFKPEFLPLRKLSTVFRAPVFFLYERTQTVVRLLVGVKTHRNKSRKGSKQPTKNQLDLRTR